MKRVVQEDEYGCAAACLAIVVGISYSEARKYLVPQYTNADQLRGALRSHGVMLGKRISLGGKTYCDLPKKDGLFFANMITARGANKWDHWMVWDAKSQSIIDPYEGPISRCRTRLLAFFPISRNRSRR
jgi:hypothetical protein